MIQTKNKLRYMEIYSDIKERIASENYGAGSLLPTEGELTQLYSASRTTIKKSDCPPSGGWAGKIRAGKGY